MTKRGLKDQRYAGITKVDGGYTVRVTHLVDGKQREVQRRLTGVTLHQAVAKREELRRELARDKDRPSEAETLTSFSVRWMDQLRATERNRQKTLEQKERVLNQWILPYLGHLPVGKIQRSDLAAWMKSLSVMRKDDGAKFCQETWGNVWRVFHTLMQDAVMMANLEHNVCSGVRFEVAGLASKQKASLSKKELDAILAETAFETADIAVMIWMLAKTGLRFSELSALKWDDIDFVTGSIRITKSQVEGVVGDTKTKRARVVPLHPKVRELLAVHRDKQKVDRVRSLSGLVFPSRVGGYRYVSCLTKPLAACVARAKVAKKVSTHVFRHSANNLLRREVGSVVAKAILGHSTDEMHERYSQVGLEEATAAVMKALG